MDVIKTKEQLLSKIASLKQERVEVIGVVRHEAWNAKGDKIMDEWIVNTITNAGKAAMAGLVGNTGSITAFTYLATGSGNTAPAASQTALVTENTANASGRAAATVSRVTTTVTNDTLQLVKQRTFSGAVTVEEIGIFNDADAGEGIMLGRQLTGTKVFSNGDIYQATYQVIFA